jgi:hypothetical protein
MKQQLCETKHDKGVDQIPKSKQNNSAYLCTEENRLAM